jgi:tetratricopeptide (TPR) repeat protein
MGFSVKQTSRWPVILALTAVLGPALALAAAANAKGQSEDLGQAAMALEQQGKTAEAEAAWKAFLKLNPASPDAYAHLGFLEARQEHYAEAVSFYHKALALNPSMPGLQMNLGLSLFKAGQLKEAVQVFDSLLKSQPSSPDAQRLTTLIGLAHYGLGEFAEAVPYLKKATAYDPQSLPFRLALAHSCLGAKQYPCVMDVYREILTLNAESAEADMLAGEAQDEMRDHGEAIKQFRAAVKADPKTPNAHFGLGYLLWTQMQYEEAAENFQAELVIDPNHAQSMAYLADCNIRMSHPEAARPLLEQAIRMDAGNQLAHLDLGILNSEAGRQDDALRELKEAVKLAPNDVNAHFRLARLLKAMGKKDEAKAEFDKTSNLTKAADESVFTKLNDARAKGPSTDGTTPSLVDK